MKNRIAQFLSLGLALVAVGAVHAQDQSVTANVPFSFYVGSTLMPQGAYRVIPQNGAVTWIKSTDATLTQAVMTINVSGKDRTEPKLVFHRYGEDYFLSEIWAGDGPVGRALTRSHREKEMAQSGTTPILTVIHMFLQR